MTTTKSLDDVILNEKTKETLDALLKQVDKNVINRLRQWGIKDKKKGLKQKSYFMELLELEKL